MRISYLASGLVLSGSLLTLALTSCSNVADDCDRSNTCGNAGGKAGSGGSGGKAAQGGAQGKGGSAGSGGSEGGEESGGLAGSGGVTAETGGSGGAENTGGTGGVEENTGGTGPVGGVGGVGGASGSGGSSGGSIGSGGSGGGQVVCDKTKSPADDACVVTSELGVFVSSLYGHDTDAGTKEKPVVSIAKGIATAIAGNKKRVYICVGTAPYAEAALNLAATASGLEIYGGFDCATWAYSTSRAAKFQSTGQTALTLNTVTGLKINNLEIKAAAGTLAQPSSVALFSVKSTAVSLTGVNLIAQAGAAGENGKDGTMAAWPVDTDLRGGDATATAGGTGCSAICPASAGNAAQNTEGGDGGNNGTLAADTDGKDGTPVYSDLTKGKGGSWTGTTCTNGVAGDNGNPGADGTGAAVLGTFSATGWAPAAGTIGKDGKVGQGGGGGSGSPSGRGGGGGCGACGGAGALPGKGGGASIALLVSQDSTITLSGTTLSTAAAGKGGDAKEGHEGQRRTATAGGAAGLQNGDDSCPGGSGGMGGPGGASGAGAGGVSVCILYAGTAKPTGADTAPCTPGKAGDGGALTPGKTTTAGKKGVSIKVASLTELEAAS